MKRNQISLKKKQKVLPKTKVQKQKRKLYYRRTKKGGESAEPISEDIIQKCRDEITTSMKASKLKSFCPSDKGPEDILKSEDINNKLNTIISQIYNPCKENCKQNKNPYDCLKNCEQDRDYNILDTCSCDNTNSHYLYMLAKKRRGIVSGMKNVASTIVTGVSSALDLSSSAINTATNMTKKALDTSEKITDTSFNIAGDVADVVSDTAKFGTRVTKGTVDTLNKGIDVTSSLSSQISSQINSRFKGQKVEI